jgi:hypothetical protein
MVRKNSVNGQVLLSLIDRHSKTIENRTVTCAATVCCHCGSDVDGSQTRFSFHGTRPRRFLVLIGPYVYRAAALLARWRCPHCRRTFTDYPPFARPCKAYTLPQMTERAATYVGSPATSYRKGVCSEHLPIFYVSMPRAKSAQDHRPDAAPDPPAMAHTSLFRWVTAFGADARRQPEDLPADLAPPARKYTSDDRRSVLIACRAVCSHLLSDELPAALPC